MTMTFYIGKDYRIYEKKWKEISLILAREMEQEKMIITKASTFRYLIDKLHNIKSGDLSDLLDKIFKTMENNKKEAS